MKLKVLWMLTLLIVYCTAFYGSAIAFCVSLFLVVGMALYTISRLS